MNLSASEKLTEGIGQLSHESLVQSFSTLRISIVKTVIDSLCYDVIKLLEKLLLTLLVILWILNQSERNIVCRDSIKQKFLMLLEFRLWITDLANYVPKSVRYKSISVELLE